jgi:hypothetical protein
MVLVHSDRILQFRSLRKICIDKDMMMAGLRLVDPRTGNAETDETKLHGDLEGDRRPFGGLDK